MESSTPFILGKIYSKFIIINILRYFGSLNYAQDKLYYLNKKSRTFLETNSNYFKEFEKY